MSDFPTSKNDITEYFITDSKNLYGTLKKVVLYFLSGSGWAVVNSNGHVEKFGFIDTSSTSTTLEAARLIKMELLTKILPLKPVTASMRFNMFLKNCYHVFAFFSV